MQASESQKLLIDYTMLISKHGTAELNIANIADTQIL
jgi:hypothetical protein